MKLIQEYISESGKHVCLYVDGYGKYELSIEEGTQIISFYPEDENQLNLFTQLCEACDEG